MQNIFDDIGLSYTCILNSQNTFNNYVLNGERRQKSLDQL